jgi:hypothetical protein
MASIEQIQALKKSLVEQINTAFAPLLTEAADAAGEDVDAENDEEAKLTPRQKLEKQLTTAIVKLTKLNEKIAGGKSKIPDKDKENKTKFEEVISKIDEKLSELDTKEAKKAAPKPAKAKAEKAPEKAPDTAVKVEKAEEAKKHVPRITPAMTTKLKEAFETASAEWDDKYKKEFVTQVNSLDDKQFAELGLEGHMSRFANTHAPAAGGGGAAAPKPKSLTVAELVKQNKNLKQVSPGVFQHKTTGEMVTGPAEDADEEFEEKKHDGDDYIVGETTKRVYKPSEEGPDEFVGYWGVGEW